VDVNQANGAKSLSALSTLLEQIPTTKTSAVLTEKLGDLYAAQGKPSSAVYASAQALKLDPSPQQRIRLRLTLGERLQSIDRDAEAYENYEELLKESPGYPDKLAIYKKLLPLAQKLNRKKDAERYEGLISGK
jgi:tetratricopeptide (TPR) repeat protein